jgi:hypothetical protein
VFIKRYAATAITYLLFCIINKKYSDYSPFVKTGKPARYRD